MKKKQKQIFRIPEWDVFKPGDLVEMKGCFFRIHRINPLAGHIILQGIRDPRPKGKPDGKPQA